MSISQMASNMTSHGGQAPINGVMPTTFCEVTYDSDWFEPDDRHLTPYRYSLMRNDTDTNSDTVSLTLPSFTYYEYLRSVYDCRTTPNANRPPPGFHGPPGSHLSEQGRATTWHAYNKDTGSELSRQGVRSEPTRIRPTYPFPSLHLIQKTKQSLQGADSEDEMDEEYAYTDRSRQKLVWVDALNKWLPQKQLQTRPYMTFVGNVPVTDRYLSPHRERQGEGDLGRPSSRPCSRVHSSLESTYRLSNKMTCINLMNNQKREIIRKRAQEIAEQKKALRKTHSTPSYDAKKKLAPDFSEAEMLQRSLSMPGSPTSLVIFPKQVWQDTGSDSTTSGKKEISITLVGAAETDQDLKEKDGMKKVTFDDKELGIDTSSPIETDNNNNNNNTIHPTNITSQKSTTANVSNTSKPNSGNKVLNKAKQIKNTKNSETANQNTTGNNNDKAVAEDATDKAEEQRLVESLEKQRQLVQQQQQQLLLAEQRADNERRAKEKAEEEEAARKLREVNNAHKQPLSQQSQNQDNVYENTMTAAAKRRKVKKPKPEKKKKAKPPTKIITVKHTPAPEKENKPAKPKTETVVKKVKEPKEPKEPEVVKPKPKPKPAAPSKPILAGMGAPQKPPPDAPQKPKPPKEERKLVTPVGYKAEPQVEKPSPPSSPKKTQRVRSIIRKESCNKPSVELLPPPIAPKSSVDDWIYGDSSADEAPDEQDRPSTQDSIPPSLPDLGNLTPEFIEKPKVKSASPVKKKVTTGAVLGNQETTKQLRRPGERDSSYADQLRREELAEERRMKQLEMFDKLKKRKASMATELEESESHNFDDNSFLAKYCIFSPGSMEMQRLAFNSVDSDNLGWLDGPDVMIALRGINHNLTESEEMYLYRVLEITGYKITHGADFKMFSVLAALSQKIASLDKWMKILIGAMDYKALEMKMFKCKTLWECNVDKDTNHISLEQLCLDLRAGGVSREHEREVRQKLQHLNALDLLDFLTYVPLFIMIHESVLENPLDNTQFR